MSSSAQLWHLLPSWSTTAVIILPFALPRFIPLARSLLCAPHTPRQPRLPLSHLQLLALSLALSLSLFAAFLPSPSSALFHALAPSQSTLTLLFPALRAPLDLRLPTASLQNRWTSLLGRALSPSELTLLAQLSTLDARVVYKNYGLLALQCAWCSADSDHFLSVLPGIALSHLTIASILAFLSPSRRRALVLWPLFLLFLAEVYFRYPPHPVPNSLLNLLIPLSHSVLLLATLFLPGPPLSTPNPIPRIRALHILQQSILRHPAFSSVTMRNAITAYGESRLAREDPAVKELWETEKKHSRETRDWVDRSLQVP